MIDYFDQKVALNNTTGNTVPNAVAQIFAMDDITFSTPLAITDLTDSPLETLVASPNGIYPAFKVPSGETQVLAKSGDVVTPITSLLGAVMAVIPNPALGEDGQALVILSDAWVIGAPVGGGGGAGGDWAGLNTVGIGRAVFIPFGGSIPLGTPDYTIVVELPEA